MLYLASQSPRRAELLAQLQRQFTTLNIEVDETPLKEELPQHYVVRLAEAKASAGLEMCQPNDMVIGSDTAVVVGSLERPVILGKPVDKADAFAMWEHMSGKTHRVMTAVAIASPHRVMHKLVVTEVDFAPLSVAQKHWYWRSGEPQDKAGGYGIQGLAGQFVKQIRGSYSAVVGLPLYETQKLINEMETYPNEC